MLVESGEATVGPIHCLGNLIISYLNCSAETGRVSDISAHSLEMSSRLDRMVCHQRKIGQKAKPRMFMAASMFTMVLERVAVSFVKGLVKLCDMVTKKICLSIMSKEGECRVKKLD